MTGPHFDQPPVSEVALAVYYSPPVPLHNVHLGLLWEQWRERYPHTEDQPPLPPVPIEQFGVAPSFGLSIQFTGTYPGSRTWFLSPNRDHVVQVQADRLILNWRRTATAPSYPSYAVLQPEFLTLVEEFDRFSADHDLGPTRIGQVEVTYVNPIPLETVGAGGAIDRLVARGQAPTATPSCRGPSRWRSPAAT